MRSGKWPIRPLGKAGTRKSDLVWVHAYVYAKYTNQTGDGVLIHSPVGDCRKKELFRVAYSEPRLGLSCGRGKIYTGHIEKGWLNPDKQHRIVKAQLMHPQRWQKPILCLEKDLEPVDEHKDLDRELGAIIREEVEFVYGESGARGLEAVVLELDSAKMVVAANLIGLISKTLKGE